MRTLPGALALLSLIGCTAPTIAPREYLDEQTAATITTVAEPWIFVQEGTSAAVGDRDYLNLYALDVNRMGDHRQYLAVLQWYPKAGARSAERVPVLELQGTGQPIVLHPTTETPRQLGVAQPPAPTFSSDAKWWYFPIDRKTLASVAHTRNLKISFTDNGERVAYVIWRDGSAELAELTTVLP